MNGENPDIKRLLQKNITLSEENNKLLKKMRRSMRWGQAFTAFYWIFIAGAAVSVYYFLQPFIDSTLAIFQELTSGVETAQQQNGNLSIVQFFDRLGKIFGFPSE